MADLLSRVATGRDRDAFAVLFRHFGPRLKSYMLRRGADAETAEELVQEVMLAVWAKADRYVPARGSVAAWIFTIARNRAIDRLRRQPPVRFADIDDHDGATDEPDGEARLMEGEMEMRVRGALDALPDGQRRIMGLAFLDGLTQAEIAVRLALPLGTVKSRMRLAYRKLRASLAEYMEDSR